jgi:hypothetical protein
MIAQIKSDWRRAKRTGQEPIFVLFWGLSFLAWGCLVAAVALLVLVNLK